MMLYCTWKSFMTKMSFVTRRESHFSAPGPSTVISPMWETSKSPAFDLTARCSVLMPVASYWTGSSQPPKSTIRPPAAMCRSYIGVRFIHLPPFFR